MHYVIDSSNSIWNDFDNVFGAALQLGAGESLILLDTGFILATGASSDAIYVNAYAEDAQVIINGVVSGTRSGIYSLGPDARIIVNGQVLGGSTGVEVSNGGGIVVNEGGLISAGSAVTVSAGSTLINNGTLTSYYGNGIQFGGGSITNNGLISGPGDSMFYVGDSAGYIENTGTMNGGISTYFGASAATAQLRIQNSGDWTGDLRLTPGDDTLNNTGLVIGDVLLGDGSDALYSQYGTITGSIDGGAGTDIIFAGDADDTISPGSGRDVVDGGGGVNTVTYQSSVEGVRINLLLGRAAGGDAAGDTLSNFQNIMGSLQRDKLTGDDNDNVLQGVLGRDTIFGNGGDDTILEYGTGTAVINGGTGNDTIYLQTLDAKTYGFGFSALSRVDGGTGEDTLRLYNAPAMVFTGTTLLNVETLLLDDGFDYQFTAHNLTVAAGKSLEVDGSSLGKGFNVIFNGKAETNGAFSFLGGGDIDQFTGGSGADKFLGGLGSDILTGGLGGDVFAYEGVTDSRFSLFDRVTDFVAGTDDFQFDTKITTVSAPVSGAASSAANLQSLVAGALAANGATLVNVTGGTYAGRSLLIVDGNGIANYQVLQDFCIDVTGLTGSLTVADFIV